MIDTDKIRAAYAATPLCQNAWTRKEGNNPTMLCAVSALVSFAGVQPDLIHKMNQAMPVNPWGGGWYTALAKPVLLAEYGMPFEVADKIPGLFDKQENEWKGVQAVLDLCERYNMAECHAEAIREDAVRFPQVGPYVSATYGISWTTAYDTAFSESWIVKTLYTMPVVKLGPKPKAIAESPKSPDQKAPTFAKSKFWTAPAKNFDASKYFLPAGV